MVLSIGKPAFHAGESCHFVPEFYFQISRYLQYSLVYNDFLVKTIRQVLVLNFYD